MLLRKQKNKFSAIIILLLFFALFWQGSDNTRAATFVEGFATTAFKDITNTTADWDSDRTTGHLINGDWRHMDGTKTPYVYVKEVELYNYEPKIISDSRGQPLMVFFKNSNPFVDFSAAKWTVGAGESVCGAGVFDCWTDLTGFESGLANSAYTMAGISSRYPEVFRQSNGYPALVFLVESSGSVYNLYYMQWTPNAANGVCSSGNACWTNALGDSEGAEKLNTNTMKYSGFYKSFDVVMDQYNKPNIVWNEFDGTNLTYHFTRWNGSNWTYADETTVGKQQLSTKVSSDNQDVESIFYGGEVYVVFRYDDYNYVGKWNGSNWVNLADSTFTNYTNMTIFKAANKFLGGMGQDKKRNHLMLSNNRFYIGVGSFNNGAAADNYLAYWDDSVDTWKYVDGTPIGNNQTAIDNMTELFNGETWNTHELFMVSLSESTKTGNILLLMSTSEATTGELSFSQWDGSQWLQPDGETVGYQIITDLVNGDRYINYSAITLDKFGQPIFSYADHAYITPQNYILPLYVSRFSGTDITGADGYVADHDIIADSGQVSFGVGILRQDIYYNSANDEIYLAALAGDGGMLITKFFANKYPDQNQDLVSATIATPHNNATGITSATLTATGDIPAGASITYYLSADGGTTWEVVTNGVEHTFTTVNPKTDLRWKANLTSANEDTTPVIQYLYIDTDAKTMGTSGDVYITAQVEPTLSLTLDSFYDAYGEVATSNSCNLSTPSKILINTEINVCLYSVHVDTNGTSGYTAYVRDTGNFSTGIDEMIDAGLTMSPNPAEAEYGIATTASGQTINQINDLDGGGVSIGECAYLWTHGTETGVNSSAVTEADQDFASATGAVADDITVLCHMAAIAGDTPNGTYTTTTIITAVGNF